MGGIAKQTEDKNNELELIRRLLSKRKVLKKQKMAEKTTPETDMVEDPKISKLTGDWNKENHEVGTAQQTINTKEEIDALKKSTTSLWGMWKETWKNKLAYDMVYPDKQSKPDDFFYCNYATEHKVWRKNYKDLPENAHVYDETHNMWWKFVDGTAVWVFDTLWWQKDVS